MGWEDQPVVENTWLTRSGKRNGRKIPQPMPVDEAQPVVETPQAPTNQLGGLMGFLDGILKGGQQPAAPAQQPTAPVQQPQAPTAQPQPTEQPTQQQVMVEDQLYNFPADWSEDSIVRWVNANPLRERREGTQLAPEQARGRSLYDDPVSYFGQRKGTPLGEVARQEYATKIKRRTETGLVDIDPKDVTPEVLSKYIENRKRASEQKSSGKYETQWKNDVEKWAWDEDTAAMERDLERVWDNETTDQYQKRIQTLQAAKEANAAQQQAPQQGIVAPGQFRRLEGNMGMVGVDPQTGGWQAAVAATGARQIPVKVVGNQQVPVLDYMTVKAMQDNDVPLNFPFYLQLSDGRLEAFNGAEQKPPTPKTDQQTRGMRTSQF